MQGKDQPFKAVLTTLGRRSGQRHSVWLLAVMYGGGIYFSRHRPDGDWFQNALKNPDVTVRIDGSELAGRASLVTDNGLAARISGLKYPGSERAREKRVVIKVTLCE